jgi:chromosome segregation ATPase
MADANAALEAARGVRDELTAAHAKIKVLEARLLALQRAASESQRLAAEAQEALEATRRELAAASGSATEVETRALARADAAAKELAAEKGRSAAAEKAHAAALAAARAEGADAAAPLRAAVAASAADLARERERCAELQRSVEHLTKAGEEAKELWARLKEALLVRAGPQGTRVLRFGPNATEPTHPGGGRERGARGHAEGDDGRVG